jgi:subtilisin family serine protease
MRCFSRFQNVGSFLHLPVLPAVLTLVVFFAGTAGPIPGTAAGRHSGYPVAFLNDRARDITGAAAVNTPGFAAPEGLTGEGQIVALADSGLDNGRMDDIHPDLRSIPGKMPKVVFLKSWAGRDVPDDPDGHGTHMAATIAGTGAASNGNFRGVAPGASIYFQSILNKDGEPAPPPRLADLFQPAYSAGARVHVDGWGGEPDAYLDPAAQTDDFVRSHPDFLVVFGAGNSGPAPGTITAEANSKNALTVGASVLPRPAFVPGPGDTASPAEFSSRGPAGDGRIKPELLAPASAVISARSRLAEGNLPGYPAYTRMQGTSMAAAVTGGASALLREYFRKYMNINTPSAALLKAALINGARPAPGGPSKEAFGVVDLAGTVIALKEGVFRQADDWAGVSQGSEISYTFHITSSAAPFKATLAWTDPPAGSGGAQTLVNDLDLVVRTPDGRVFYGNHFAGGNRPDRTNNVEQVCLPDPVPGDYTVRVAGAGVRRNVLSGSAVPVQDYALVWGQAPEMDMVKGGDGKTIALSSGRLIKPDEMPVVNLVDGRPAPVDAGHIFPGAAAYLTRPAGAAGDTPPLDREPPGGGDEDKDRPPEKPPGPQRAYLVARLWRAAGVKAFNMGGETVFTEINPAERLGGYTLAADAGEVMLNKSPAPPGKLPQGFEAGAVVNPIDQKIRQVSADYIEREGVVADVSYEKGERKIHLAGGRGNYRVSPGAVYSYEDSYTGADIEDMPFGTGALDELEEVLPGMPVRLHLAPSSGEVQYLAVKRRVTLGTVREISPANGEIKMENGSSFQMFPGAPVKVDREAASLGVVKHGDQVAAVLLPDTGEAIGLVAYSNVIYGKAVDFTRKDRTLYLLEDNNRYRSLYLPPDAVIYRWGVRAAADAIAAGSRIRITTDPGGKEVWRLDVTDTLDDKGMLAECNGAAGVLTTREGVRYRIAGSTRFYKNGYSVPPEGLRDGDQVELEYVTAPPPTGKVLVSVSARTSTGPPPLLASAVPLRDRLAVTGTAGADADIFLQEKDGSWRAAPVDGSGRFNYSLQPGDKEGIYDFALVAVGRNTGGVAGAQVFREVSGRRGRYDAAVLDAVSGAMVQTGRDTLPDRAGAGYPPGEPLTRASAVAALAQLFSWPGASQWPLPFNDAQDIPAALRPAVAEARARGIVKGYPDGTFRPAAALSRAEAAVILAAALRELGLDASNTAPAPPYRFAGDIPYWAAKAVAGTAAAGLIPVRPDGAFAPDDPVTVKEMAALLERLLAVCEDAWAKQPDV